MVLNPNCERVWCAVLKTVSQIHVKCALLPQVLLQGLPGGALAVAQAAVQGTQQGSSREGC
jgi:hypothetical protein